MRRIPDSVYRAKMWVAGVLAVIILVLVVVGHARAGVGGPWV